MRAILKSQAITTLIELGYPPSLTRRLLKGLDTPPAKLREHFSLGVSRLEFVKYSIVCMCSIQCIFEQNPSLYPDMFFFPSRPSAAFLTMC